MELLGLHSLQEIDPYSSISMLLHELQTNLERTTNLVPFSWPQTHNANHLKSEITLMGNEGCISGRKTCKDIEIFRRLSLTCTCNVSKEEIKIQNTLSFFLTPQWKYDHMSATYLLLLSKKARGKRVRLRFPCLTGHASTMMSTGLEVSLSSAGQHLA